MSANHTPTPWRIERGSIIGLARAHDGEDAVHGSRSESRVVANVPSSGFGDYQYYPREIAEANAEFIVRACNSFDALVNACGAALRHIEKRDLASPNFEFAAVTDELRAALQTGGAS